MEGDGRTAGSEAGRAATRPVVAKRKRMAESFMVDGVCVSGCIGSGKVEF